jgi:hypothetical protein
MRVWELIAYTCGVDVRLRVTCLVGVIAQRDRNLFTQWCEKYGADAFLPLESFLLDSFLPPSLWSSVFDTFLSPSLQCAFPFLFVLLCICPALFSLPSLHGAVFFYHSMCPPPLSQFWSARLSSFTGVLPAMCRL